ncbi:hypothetical protein L1987_58977 [Smallanthus sonchifolius]|uniref:Uncharacterized protein n=1 Tax=Smallanthus sonchifolius TaxID=185202 RepID=A0ACB9D4D7_9ASTR|nr:hypothetical protein L1987_58977 [Smallanthus sonchifolius]
MDLASQAFGLVVNNSAYDDDDDDDSPCTVVDFGKKETNLNEEHITSFDDSSSPSSVREKNEVEASHCAASEDSEKLENQGPTGLSGTF